MFLAYKDIVAIAWRDVCAGKCRRQAYRGRRLNDAERITYNEHYAKAARAVLSTHPKLRQQLFDKYPYLETALTRSIRS